MNRMVALLVASAVSACAGEGDGGKGREIPVLVPLSGADASRGDAVAKVASIVNDLFAEGGGSSAEGPSRFIVRDAHLTDDALAQIVAQHEASPVFITGDCSETRRVQERLKGRPHFIVSLFCDSVEGRASIEAEDRTDSVLWLGPLQVSFMRGLSAFVRERVMLEFSTGIPSYDFLRLVVASDGQDAFPDAVKAFTALQRYGIPVAIERVPACEVTSLRDYTATILSLDGQLKAAAAESPPRRGLVFLLMPWLSTTEWMRQAEVVLGPSEFAVSRASWLAPLDYQVDDPQVSMSPFPVHDLMIMTQLNAASVDGVRALDDAMLARHGIRGRSLVTRVALDAFAAVALAMAKAPSSADAMRDELLSVTDRKEGDEPADFSDLADAVRSVSDGVEVNYDGVFSKLDGFDRFGQLSRDVRTAVRRLVPSGDLPVLVKPDDIFIDPLEGEDVSLGDLVARGCVVAEPTVDSAPWEAARFQSTYDRDVATGIVGYSEGDRRAGILLHFARPARVTGVYFQHFKSFGEQSTLPSENRLLWWRAPTPQRFDHRRAPPDGAVELGETPKGGWSGADLSFESREVQTLALLTEYTLVRASEFGELFTDLHLFLDASSAETLCP